MATIPKNFGEGGRGLQPNQGGNNYASLSEILDDIEIDLRAIATALDTVPSVSGVVAALKTSRQT